MNRNNPHDNFEACYLKENMAKKAFANSVEVSKLLVDKDFERCMRYVTKIIFAKNREVLMKHGFDYDDMLNIIKVLGVQFVNHPFEGETPKDTSYILLRHTMQRVGTFFQFLNRKFRIGERHLDLNLDDVFFNDPMGEQEDYPIADYVPDDTQPEFFESKEERRVKLDAMRENLEENIDQYRDRLAEMATSKLVEYSVRKKAREMCRKYGIDYLNWAKGQIAARNLNSTDFVLE
jgi:hypothetical protein